MQWRHTSSPKRPRKCLQTLSPKKIMTVFWDGQAAIRIAVDGGACQLKRISDEELNLIPDVICGDFDSVTPDVIDYYQKKGVEIVHTPDQDETDFTKAVRLSVQYIDEKKLQVSAIVAVARNGERLDHILGNLNTLYTANEITSIPVFILGHGSLTWLFCPLWLDIIISFKAFLSTENEAKEIVQTEKAIGSERFSDMEEEFIELIQKWIMMVL
ncbi:Thiamin pyrophosphokinase 1, partial [Stegodyphus mimosarum]